MVTARLSKTVAAILLALFAVIQAGAAPFAVVPQPEKPLRIFLRGAPKNHGPAGNGLHDSEVWVREWGALLTARGARVDGGLQFPTPSQLENTDVLVMFAANAGTILGAERASLQSFLKRGGGIVCLHDSVVTAREPHWFKTIVGGAWENGVAKYLRGREHLLLRQHRAPHHERRIELHDHRRSLLGPAYDAGRPDPRRVDAAEGAGGRHH